MKFKPFLPHLAAIAVFLVTVVVLFLPHFQGKVLRQGDLVNYQGASKEYTDYTRQEERRMNWTGSMFGGMPTYQIARVSEGNYLPYSIRLINGFMGGPAGYFFGGMLCFYLMMVLLGVGPWLSLAGAVMTALATNNIVLYGAGHVTKLAVVFYLPLLALGILLAFRRKYLLGGLTFAFGMGMAVYANHPQMVYYFGLTLPFFGVAQFIRCYRRGELGHFARATAALVVGLLLALGAGATNLLTTTEYLPQTIRGGQVLSSAPTAQGDAPAPAASSTTSSGGLEWEYAMGWSNGFKDMLSTYVPRAAGGGSGEEIENKTAIGRAMSRAGFRLPKTFAAPLYHGSLPFTEGPIYLGAVVWALFLFGLFTAPRWARVWFGGGTALVLLLSLGKNLEGVNRLLFDHLPLLNTFRTPNSALSISVFLMVALGVFGLHRWRKELSADRDAAGRRLRNAGVLAAALGALVYVLGYTLDYSYFKDVQNLTSMLGGQGDVNQLIPALEETRMELYFPDAARSLLFVGLTFAALYLVWRATVPVTVGVLIVGGLGLADFAGISSRYLTKDDFLAKRVVDNSIPATPADEAILQDPDPNYRVYNLSRPLDQDAYTSYYHKSLGGYSAVKLRRYQDLIDGYLRRGNPAVVNMLNTKYLLRPGPDGQLQAQQNPDAFGHAWLVSDIETVDSPDAEFAALGTVEDLRTTAIVHTEFSPQLANLSPSGEGTIELTSYLPDRLTYNFSAAGDQLVVFSEIWYGPDLGWSATIDGEPAELIRANYALRALRVPGGQHEIVLSFTPQSYATGKLIATVSSLLILFGLIGLLVYRYVLPRFRDPE